MQVDDKNDRMESPGICDYCGSESNNLKRFYNLNLPNDSILPEHQVDWECPYCAVSFDKEDSTSKTLASMFNLLEERLKK